MFLTRTKNTIDATTAVVLISCCIPATTKLKASTRSAGYIIFSEALTALIGDILPERSYLA